jgi:hypothetical protein
MIPRLPLPLDPSVPPEHTGWTPRRDELDETGFRGFPDTWLIRGIGVRETKSIIGVEEELINLADRFAVAAEEFDAICSAFEDANATKLPERLQGPSIPEELAFHLAPDDYSPTDGLDLGVAGLVYALAAGGCWTAASCRGHPGKYAWADHPVVVLACDRHRASVLQRWPAQAHCGFTTDGRREGLLAVVGESVTDTMMLAGLVVSHKKDFIPSRVRRSMALEKGGQGRFGDG